VEEHADLVIEKLNGIRMKGEALKVSRATPGQSTPDAE